MYYIKCASTIFSYVFPSVRQCTDGYMLNQKDFSMAYTLNENMSKQPCNLSFQLQVRMIHCKVIKIHLVKIVNVEKLCLATRASQLTLSSVIVSFS